jgi:hypothetical protein
MRQRRANVPAAGNGTVKVCPPFSRPESTAAENVTVWASSVGNVQVTRSPASMVRSLGEKASA